MSVVSRSYLPLLARVELFGSCSSSSLFSLPSNPSPVGTLPSLAICAIVLANRAKQIRRIETGFRSRPSKESNNRGGHRAGGAAGPRFGSFQPRHRPGPLEIHVRVGFSGRQNGTGYPLEISVARWSCGKDHRFFESYESKF